MSAPVGHIKGTGIISVVRALRARREAAIETLPAALHHYLDQRITISSWYPESEYVVLMTAFLRLYKGVTWHSAGEIAAREALTGVYRNIVVAGDIGETARRMRVNWRNYHDTGVLSVEVEPHLVRVRVSEYCLLSSDVCRLNQGYFGALLGLSGSLITESRKVRCRVLGHEACVWEYGYGASS